MLMNRFLCFQLLIVLAAPGFAFGDACGAVKKEVPFRSELGDTGVFANLRGTADCVKVRSHALLKDAAAKQDEQKPPEGLCPAGCQPVSKPVILFRSEPNKLLEEYDDKPACDQLFVQTQKEPITFFNRKFPDIDEVADYFGEFSQGKGTDGERLYEICHSTCSPRYTATIEEEANGFVMNTAVICGAARDRDDGQYRLSAHYEWTCVSG